MTVETLAQYRVRIERLHDELGIPSGFTGQRDWPLQLEAGELVDAGPDWYGRPQRLQPAAQAAWQRMRHSAAGDGVPLHLISAFRSVDYQCQVIRRKREAGRSMDDILRVNALPGYSEHHTGRAIDLGTPDCPVLEEVFEQTAAFDWLRRHAGAFGFILSYPRDNSMGMAYEPWHWCHHSDLDKFRTRE